MIKDAYIELIFMFSGTPCIRHENLHVQVEDIKVEFTWKRCRLFDQQIVEVNEKIIGNDYHH